jgi:hypothetical protein
VQQSLSILDVACAPLTNTFDKWLPLIESTGEVMEGTVNAVVIIRDKRSNGPRDGQEKRLCCADVLPNLGWLRRQELG